MAFVAAVAVATAAFGVVVGGLCCVAVVAFVEALVDLGAFGFVLM